MSGNSFIASKRLGFLPKFTNVVFTKPNRNGSSVLEHTVTVGESSLIYIPNIMKRIPLVTEQFTQNKL